MGAFEQAYAELHDFVRAHEGIRVMPTSLSVPRDVRPAFYELVECVQRELAREILDGQAARASRWQGRRPRPRMPCRRSRLLWLLTGFVHATKRPRLPAECVSPTLSR